MRRCQAGAGRAPAVELAELRERVGRAEAERDQARAERERVEREVAEVRPELASWAAGGPLARALRAFLLRRWSGR
jgi:FtsZ-binding cell division protein ZapB